jgi:hypothetical protein
MTPTAKTFDRQTAKFLSVVGENMPEIPSSLMQEWIEHPDDLQQALWKALCPIGAEPELPSWRMLRLGACNWPSGQSLCRTLQNEGFRINDWAADILNRVSLALNKTEVELVKISAGELGFKTGAQTHQVYDRAKKLGLDPVAAEAGPQLRRQYRDQPMDEWLVVGSEPIAGPSGLAVFCVGHGTQGLWLRAHFGHAGELWKAEKQWVFARRKPANRQ